MVRKFGKILCSMFLFAFLAMTLHKHNRSNVIPPKCASTKQKIVQGRGPSNLNLLMFVCRWGGGGGANDEVWDRETMFSQLAKRSIRGLVSGLPRRRSVFSHDFNFGFERWVISKELRILSPPAKEYNGGISESANFFFAFRKFDYFALGKSVKIGRNSTSLEM